MYKETLRPAWVEINLINLNYNIQQIIQRVGSSDKIIGIIKADAYGHGAKEVAKALKNNGISRFGVATLDEAIALRDAGFQEEIVILGLTPSIYSDTIIKYNLTPVVGSFESANSLSKKASKANTTVAGYIALDTGMGRIGYLPDDPLTTSSVLKIDNLEAFNIKGLFSHFATADYSDKSFSEKQLSLFTDFITHMKLQGLEFPIKTFANSAAIMDFPSSYFDLVRPGIALYGCYPSDDVGEDKLALRSVMSVKASIINLKKVPAGTSVGYGRKFIAEKESLIATIALGYADGLPRPYAKEGQVLVNGCFAPIAGNICMDQTMIDVTTVPNVKLGNLVTIMGSDLNEKISASEIGKKTQTINYEIVCAFGQRLPKVYLD